MLGETMDSEEDNTQSFWYTLSKAVSKGAEHIFKNTLRMSVQKFNELLSLVQPLIWRKGYCYENGHPLLWLNWK